MLGELVNLKALIVLNADKDVEQHEFSFITGSNTKWHSHLGSESVVLTAIQQSRPLNFDE